MSAGAASLDVRSVGGSATEPSRDPCAADKEHDREACRSVTPLASSAHARDPTFRRVLAVRGFGYRPSTWFPRSVQVDVCGAPRLDEKVHMRRPRAKAGSLGRHSADGDVRRSTIILLYHRVAAPLK